MVDAEKNEVEAFTDPAALRLLHFESYSGEDFVRKWTSILAAGPKPNFRPAREPTAIALQTLIAKGLSAEAGRALPDAHLRAHHRGRLRHPARPRPAGARRPARRHPHPDPVPDSSLADLLAAVRREPKRPFHHGTPPAQVRKILARVSR